MMIRLRWKLLQPLPLLFGVPQAHLQVIGMLRLGRMRAEGFIRRHQHELLVVHGMERKQTMKKSHGGSFERISYRLFP